MPTERERVRALMCRGEPIPVDDAIVAQMIIAEEARKSRSRSAFFVLALAALVFVVVYGVVTKHWEWFPMAILILMTFGAARQVHALRRAQGWANRYPHASPGGPSQAA